MPAFRGAIRPNRPVVDYHRRRACLRRFLALSSRQLPGTVSSLASKSMKTGWCLENVQGPKARYSATENRRPSRWFPRAALVNGGASTPLTLAFHMEASILLANMCPARHLGRPGTAGERGSGPKKSQHNHPLHGRLIGWPVSITTAGYCITYASTGKQRQV